MLGKQSGVDAGKNRDRSCCALSISHISSPATRRAQATPRLAPRPQTERS